MTVTESFVDLPTTAGPMRVHVFAPARPGHFPGLLFYSEIFQVTGPIRRFASWWAGQGYLVAVPEVYHEFEPAGTVLAYDQAGSDRGNALKYTKTIASYDEDATVTAAFLKNHPLCNGAMASLGVCLGGHLAVRAGFHSDIRAVVAFYPTDLHGGTLGAGKRDDTLARFAGVSSSYCFVWGQEDPHIPAAGRRLIYDRLAEVGVDFEWHEFKAAHAFLRDEGPRYNPALARVAMEVALRFLHEKLAR
jgi:carboxymethylenebutenolidase